MLTDPQLRSQVDQLWDKLWTGGLSNPLDAIEQLSYLLFLKRLDDVEDQKERQAKRQGQLYMPAIPLELRWKRVLGYDVTGIEVLGADDGPGDIAVAARSGFVMTFDAQGNQQWAVHVGAPVEFLARRRLAAEEVLVAVCDGGRILVLSTEGVILGRGETGGAPVAVAAPDRRQELLLVADASGRITALEVK